MPNKDTLDKLNIPVPCVEKWENMIGDSRKRFCHGCQKDVNDLSSMSQRQAVRFAAKNEGKVCIRYVRRQDGSLLTTDRPLHQISPRRAAIAAGVIAASVSFSIGSYGQNNPMPTPEQSKISKPQDTRKLQLSEISFTIADITGAVVPNAKVSLINQKTHKESLTLTNQDGLAQFFSLERDNYDLSVECCGFEKNRKTIQIKEPVEPNVKITLQVPSGAVGDFIFDWSDIPLFRAIAQHDNDTVKKAIASGFDVNKKDSYRNTALLVAVDHCNLDIVNLLLEKGARVNDKDAENRTPILKVDCHENQEKDGEQIVRLLIKNGADVNVHDEDGQTLLMQAAENGSIVGVQLLLDAGAKPNLKDPDGETAYQKTNSDEIKRLLIQYGAHPK